MNTRATVSFVHVAALALLSLTACSPSSTNTQMLPDFSATSRAGKPISADMFRKGSTIVYIPGRGISRPSTIFAWISEYEKRWGKIEHRLCLSDGSVILPPDWIEVRNSGVIQRFREHFGDSTLISFNNGAKNLKCVAEYNQKEKIYFLLHRIVNGATTIQSLIQSHPPEEYILPREVYRRLFGESYKGPACILFLDRPDSSCGEWSSLLDVTIEQSKGSSTRLAIILLRGTSFESDALSHNYHMENRIIPAWNELTRAVTSLQEDNLGFAMNFAFLYTGESNFMRTIWIGQNCEELQSIY